MATAGDVAPGNFVAFVVAGSCLQKFSRVAWIVQMPERWFPGPRTMARFGGVADRLLARVGISGLSPVKATVWVSEGVRGSGTCKEGVMRTAQHIITDWMVERALARN